MNGSENAAIGAGILDNKLMRGPLAHLSVFDFSGGLNQDIFSKMLQLSADGQTFDAIVLAEALKPTRHFQNGDGAIYLEALTDGVIPELDRVQFHVRKILEQS